MMDLFLTMIVAIGSKDAGFCANTANIWQIVGYILMVFKIIIPIILTVMGMLDLGKAVVASKSDEVKKASTTLAFRVVGAVIIFLIPTIIGFIIGVIGGFSDDVETDYNVCKSCIVSPSKCEAEARKAWGNE